MKKDCLRAVFFYLRPYTSEVIRYTNKIQFNKLYNLLQVNCKVGGLGANYLYTR